MRKISRRQAFVLLGSAAAIGSTGGVAWNFVNSDFTVNALCTFVRTHFSYLQLEVSDSELQSFVDTFVAIHGPVERNRSDLQSQLFGTVTDNPELMKLALQFVLSTDFFENGADESKPVSFVAYYDPYMMPCWNPLVRYP